MKSPIRVLHLIQYGKLGGGVNKTLITQLAAMDSNRFKTYAIAAESGPFVDELRKHLDEIAVIPAPQSILYQSREQVKLGISNLINFLQLVPFFLRCARFIMTRQIDVIHCHNLKTNFFGIVLGKLCRVKTICHIRSATPLGIMGRIYEWGATQIVSVSAGARDASFSQLARPEKHLVIYNGRDLDEFRPDSGTQAGNLRKELNLPQQQTIVGIVGGLIRWKGHTTFIQAAHLVLQQQPDMHFLIVGDADYESPQYIDELKNLITTLGIENSITFTGYRTDVNLIYNTIDILVSSSWYEALGGVMIEAMASAKPVIGTNSGGTPEIIHDQVTGLLVPVQDPDALAAALLPLSRDSSLRDEMGKQGRQRVEMLFSVARYVEDIQNLYARLATS